MYIFTTPAGVMTTVVENALPSAFASFDMTDWRNMTRCAITGLAFKTNANAQFFKTLQNFIYFYIFGENMGDLTISGLCCNAHCADLQTGMGLEEALTYYKNHSAVNIGGPITVQIGSFGFTAFLTSGDFVIADPATKITRFTFTLATDPQLQ